MNDVTEDVDEADADEQDHEEDEQITPAPDSDVESQPATPAFGRGSSTRGRKRGGRGRGRGRGRPPLIDPDARDGDSGTPRKTRARGRGFGGGRWAKPRGGPSHVTQVPLDKLGNMANVRDDEVELPEDSEGEEKVDKNGNLKGDREYRVRTFSIEGKGDRLYMLSTEPARCIGFRDSYLFFQKHPQLFKIILEEDAKKDLIERSLIPHSYKGRAIGVVTARSVFREFGAKIIIGGKRITDDYQVKAARAEGAIEGEFAVPEDNIPATGDEYDRNRFVAWHGASAVYHTGAPSVPAINGKIIDGKKRKPLVTGTNWMFEHARATRYAVISTTALYVKTNPGSQFNSSLAANRRFNLNGVYDVHTNIIQYPKIMQHTHAKWEQIFPETIEKKSSIQLDSKPNGIDLDENESAVQEYEERHDSIFPPLPKSYAHNFTIVDTYAQGPPTSTFDYPGPPGSVIDVGPPGLTDVSDDIINELPADCQLSFYEAQAEEKRWKSNWGNEEQDKMRAQVHITYNI